MLNTRLLWYPDGTFKWPVQSSTPCWMCLRTLVPVCMRDQGFVVPQLHGPFQKAGAKLLVNQVPPGNSEDKDKHAQGEGSGTWWERCHMHARPGDWPVSQCQKADVELLVSNTGCPATQRTKRRVQSARKVWLLGSRSSMAL